MTDEPIVHLRKGGSADAAQGPSKPSEFSIPCHTTVTDSSLQARERSLGLIARIYSYSKRKYLLDESRAIRPLVAPNDPYMQRAGSAQRCANAHQSILRCNNTSRPIVSPRKGIIQQGGWTSRAEKSYVVYASRHTHPRHCLSVTSAKQAETDRNEEKLKMRECITNSIIARTNSARRDNAMKAAMRMSQVRDLEDRYKMFLCEMKQRHKWRPLRTVL